ncbi:hypothetical protein NJH77_05355 [Serratia fonticola]|uniref:winged helix-turn-helix domain-containing protein n=1 Tax=Serratia fonticola TaxID=47917 RepID=UPI0020972145|nr:hypothetical protein [Serratia fonticola]MCO7508681.1 hypothetical protein [Serratia fonticola]MDK2376509.1 hypothetical protein [Serratia fonticola]
MTQHNKLNVCGFTLGGNILFYPQDNVLMNFSKKNLCRVQIRPTMANLLSYLLNNSGRKYILDDEIMSNVWEVNNLQASTHRLWQVSRDLKFKLRDVGLESELFSRAERRGFSVNDNLVMPIYCEDAIDADGIEKT